MAAYAETILTGMVKFSPIKYYADEITPVSNLLPCNGATLISRFWNALRYTLHAAGHVLREQ